MAKTIQNQDEVRSIFEDVCARKELLILITQYLKFESTFVWLDGNEIHAKTASGGEAALKILGVTDLKLRFPYRMDFLEVSTNFLGIGSHDGVKTVRFAMPTAVYANDGRKSPRITVTGDLFATFKLKGRRLIRIQVANISATGAGLTLSEDLPISEFRVNDRIMLTINLTDNLTINNGAVVRNMTYRSFGVEFSPALSESDLNAISKWAFQLQEKERDSIASRLDLSTSAALAANEKERNIYESEILFLSRDDCFEQTIRDTLGKNRKFSRALPSVAALKEALSNKPHLVIFHASNGNAVEKLMLKSLSEIVPWGVPLLVIGTGVDNDSLSEIGQACRAVSSIPWALNKASFLQRLILGILRRYYGEGDSPMAPGAQDS